MVYSSHPPKIYQVPPMWAPESSILKTRIAGGIEYFRAKGLALQHTLYGNLTYRVAMEDDPFGSWAKSSINGYFNGTFSIAHSYHQQRSGYVKWVEGMMCKGHSHPFPKPGTLGPFQDIVSSFRTSDKNHGQRLALRRRQGQDGGWW